MYAESNWRPGVQWYFPIRWWLFHGSLVHIYISYQVLEFSSCLKFLLFDKLQVSISFYQNFISNIYFKKI